MRLILTVTALVLLFTAGRAQNPSHTQMNIRKIVVDEVLQTANYTYLHGDVNGASLWVALPKIKASVGDEFYYQKGIEMRDFKSTELKRTFDTVWFIQGVDRADVILGNTANSPGNQRISTQKNPHKQALVNEKPGLNIEPAEGSITIAELLANKGKYEGKTVKMKGRVVKYNSKIMGKNWIHLQDGTEFSGEFDLVVTTDMDAKIGDTVLVEGRITLDKDFGYGYFYKVIMEEGRILDE